MQAVIAKCFQGPFINAFDIGCKYLDSSLSDKHQRGKTREDNMFGTRMPADAGVQVSGIREHKPIWLAMRNLHGMVTQRYSLSLAPNLRLILPIEGQR